MARRWFLSESYFAHKPGRYNSCVANPFASSCAHISVFVMCSVLSSGAADKQSASPCDKPRQIASQPHLSKEEQKKAHAIRAQGTVAISITEEGDVVDAKVVRASSANAVDLLLRQAKSIKFKPRPGCGTTHTVVNFSLAGQ